jgi:DNA-binding response OmpR family regulator
MLVDDDVDIIETYKPVLEAAGYEVRYAHDSERLSGSSRNSFPTSP